MGPISSMQDWLNIKNQCKLSYKFKKKNTMILLIDKEKLIFTIRKTENKK